MSVQPDYWPCRCCGGTGRIELTGVYAETLKALRRLDREVNGADLARLVGAEPTAVNNRLVRLEELGFAAGRADGRQRLWAATKAEPVEHFVGHNQLLPAKGSEPGGRD